MTQSLYGIPLTQEQLLIKDTAQKLAQDEVAPAAMERDRSARFPAHLIPRLGSLGLLGIKVPLDDGGAGADMTSYVLAIAAVSRACASTGVTMAVCNLAADIVARHGTAEQKRRWLEPYLLGKLGAGTFALSEPHCGSDASALSTTAVRDGNDFVLDGSKQWITNGGFAGVHLVFAKTSPDKGSRGITCFLVEQGTKGLLAGKEEKKMGLRASNTAQLHLEGCRVPASHVLGEVDRGYGIALGALDGGRLGIAAQSLGIAEAALAEGVRYAKERKAFGKHVADFQASQMAIADSQLELEQAWLLTLRAASEKDAGGDRTAKASSMAKLAASESCCRIVDRMLQLHGGYGYVEDFPIERLYRDARVTRIYEGTSEVQRLVIAREVLDDS
jgi:alkylation response protein AidB-like acyl-CoA dehydrogenase